MSRRRARAALVLAFALTAACGGQAVGSQTVATARHRPHARHRALIRHSGVRLAPSIASARGTLDYEYVFVDNAAYVYDMNHHLRLVTKLSLPGITSVRGVGVDLRNHMLYISYGGDGGYTGNGALAAYDLLAGQIAWTVSYPHGVDSFAISGDGSRIYLPDGERSSDGNWWVLSAADGSTIGRISAGLGPHNTVAGLSGRYVYLGGHNYPYLEVASAATGRVVRRIGPLYSGVRPFTVNGRETLAFTTATGFLGFQVSNIRTGHVLFTEGFGRRFGWDPSSFPLTAPSHGISLSPNERRLWVIDTPNSYVHVFDISGLPSRRPREIANIPLTHSFLGSSSYCSQDCERDGWLQNSLNGCFVFVGNSGDVLSAVTMRRVGYLPAMYDSREMVEVDWRAGVPVATSTKSGLGYVTARYRPPPPHCSAR